MKTFTKGDKVILNGSISYGQDFGFWTNNFDNDEFTFIEELDNGMIKLIAPGFGEKDNYGNGAIYVTGLDKDKIKLVDWDTFKWTKHKPLTEGWYWCFQYGRVRIVHVWRYKGESDLFTNEDGGASLDDSDYNSALWWPDPIKPPVLPGGV